MYTLWTGNFNRRNHVRDQSLTGWITAKQNVCKWGTRFNCLSMLSNGRESQICKIPVHCMKEIDTGVVNRNPDASSKWVVMSRAGRFTPGKEHQYALKRRLHRPRSVWIFWKRNYLSSIRIRISDRPACSLVSTEYANLARRADDKLMNNSIINYRVFKGTCFPYLENTVFDSK